MTRWLAVGLVLILAVAWWLLRNQAVEVVADGPVALKEPRGALPAAQPEPTSPRPEVEAARPSRPLEVVDAGEFAA